MNYASIFPFFDNYLPCPFHDSLNLLKSPFLCFVVLIAIHRSNVPSSLYEPLLPVISPLTKMLLNSTVFSPFLITARYSP